MRNFGQHCDEQNTHLKEQYDIHNRKIVQDDLRTMQAGIGLFREATTPRFRLNMTYKVKYFKGLTVDTKGLSEHDTFSI